MFLAFFHLFTNLPSKDWVFYPPEVTYIEMKNQGGTASNEEDDQYFPLINNLQSQNVQDHFILSQFKASSPLYSRSISLPSTPPCSSHDLHLFPHH